MHLTKVVTRFLPLFVIILVFCVCTTGYQNAADFEDDPAAGDEDVFAALFGGQDAEPPAEAEPQTTTPDTATPEPAAEPQAAAEPELEPLYGPPPAAREDNQPAPTPAPASRTLRSSDSVSLVQEAKRKNNNKITLSFQLPSDVQVYRERYPDLRFDLARSADGERVDITIEPANPDIKFSFVPFSSFGFNPENYSLPGEDLSIGSVYLYFYDNNGLILRYQYQYLFYDVKDAVRGFVEQYFNSRLKTITFTVEDYDSHYPMQNANVKISGTPPSPLRLLLKYFGSIQLLDYALSVVPNYVKDSSAQLTNLNGTSFVVYFPESYSLKISHPNYYYFTETLDVDEDVEGYHIRLSKSHSNNMVQAQPKDKSYNQSQMMVISGG